jgi:hypothetical protein
MSCACSSVFGILITEVFQDTSFKRNVARVRDSGVLGQGRFDSKSKVRPCDPSSTDSEFEAWPFCLVWETESTSSQRAGQLVSTSALILRCCNRPWDFDRPKSKLKIRLLRWWVSFLKFSRPWFHVYANIAWNSSIKTWSLWSTPLGTLTTPPFFLKQSA